jgi:hypothetical protein
METPSRSEQRLLAFGSSPVKGYAMRKRLIVLGIGVLAVALMGSASPAEAHGPHHFHHWWHARAVPFCRPAVAVVPVPRPAPVVYYYPQVVVPVAPPVVRVVTPVVPAPVVVQGLVR